MIQNRAILANVRCWSSLLDGLWGKPDQSGSKWQKNYILTVLGTFLVESSDNIIWRYGRPDGLLGGLEHRLGVRHCPFGYITSITSMGCGS